MVINQAGQRTIKRGNPIEEEEEEEDNVEEEEEERCC